MRQVQSGNDSASEVERGQEKADEARIAGGDRVDQMCLAFCVNNTPHLFLRGCGKAPSTLSLFQTLTTDSVTQRQLEGKRLGGGVGPLEIASTVA